ncbi:MAG: FHA domain-containing protein [Deltaproteobacteria bacterium]|nr:FHA domain-containing protein [Deltaproteobacteria bacterium]
MELAQAQELASQKGFPFSGLDDFFKNLSGRMKDGYVLATSGDTDRYLFIMDGRPYTAAAIGHGGRQCTPIKDFFAWYKEKGTADIRAFSSDKKLLLCMLVRLNYAPAQSFSTDVVNLEDVVKRMEKQNKDAVMAIGNEAGQWGFAIFLKGRAVLAAMPRKQGSPSGEEGDTPLDRILLYSYDAPAGKPLSVEIYPETRVTPAGDCAPFPAEGIAGYYTKAPLEAYVECVEDNRITGVYPLTAGGKLTIGRETTNAMRLSEAGVSREHAVIRFEKGRYVVEDLKSANGTFFRGIRIGVKDLFDGDEVNIRKYTLRFHGPGAEEKTVSRRPASAANQPASTANAAKGGKEPAGPAGRQAGPSLLADDGTLYHLGAVTTIGRDEESDIKFGGMLVPRRLAAVIRGKDVYKIVRKGITAVRVNGEKVDERMLKDNDMIEIGGRIFKFRAGKTAV